MTMQRLLLTLFVFTAWSACAAAQAPKKCVDAAGKVTYSDQACPNTSFNSGVKLTDNVVDSREERLGSVRMRDERLAIDRAGQQRAAAIAASGADEPGKPTACTDEVARRGGISSRQRAELLARCQAASSTDATPTPGECAAQVAAMTALTPLQRSNALAGCRSAAASAQTGGANAAATTAVIAGCDSSGCWDVAGERYNAQGNFLISLSGRVCRRAGSTLRCN